LDLALVRHRAGVSRRLRVSDDELTVLLYLAEDGGVTQGGLASLTNLSRSGVSAMVQRLERAGLVERYPAPGDKRIRMIRLSSRGSARMTEAYSERNAELRRLLGELPADHIDDLDRFLAGLAAATEERVSDPGAEPISEPVLADPIWRLWG